MRAWVIMANLSSYMLLLALMVIARQYPACCERLFDVFRPASEAMLEIVSWLAALGLAPP